MASINIHNQLPVSVKVKYTKEADDTLYTQTVSGATTVASTYPLKNNTNVTVSQGERSLSTQYTGQARLNVLKNGMAGFYLEWS